MSLIIDSLAKLAEKFSQKYPGEASGVATLDGNGDVVEAALKVEAGGVDLRCKVIEIGDWNMVAFSNESIPHGLTYANIRNVSVMIRNDDDTLRYMVPGYGQHDGGAVLDVSINTVASANIVLIRQTGGNFDSANFDATSYNRGWVTIWYVP